MDESGDQWLLLDGDLISVDTGSGIYPLAGYGYLLNHGDFYLIIMDTGSGARVMAGSGVLEGDGPQDGLFGFRTVPI